MSAAEEAVVAMDLADPGLWSALLVLLVCGAAVRLLHRVVSAVVCVAVLGVFLGWWHWTAVWPW